ncbi:MAG: outer membrane beta-barrel protein [Rhodothermales bacterium]
MKNVYYAGVMCAMLCALTISTSHAKDITPVGLRSDAVRMSSHEQLASAYLLPVYTVLNAMEQENAFLRVEPEEGEQLIGGGLIYGSEIEKLGLQLSYFYFMTTAIALGGDISFFFPEKTEFVDSSFTQTLFTLNVMAHYVVFTTLIFRAYVLAGLNYAVFRFKSEGEFISGSSSSSEIGLNLGGGIEYALAAGFLFLELKYILSDFDQLVLAVGYRHVLGR